MHAHDVIAVLPHRLHRLEVAGFVGVVERPVGVEYFGDHRLHRSTVPNCHPCRVKRDSSLVLTSASACDG